MEKLYIGLDVQNKKVCLISFFPLHSSAPTYFSILKTETEEQLIEKLEKVQSELEPLEQQRIELEKGIESRTNMLVWGGLAFMAVQFGFLARLTWWEYSWDIMEPVTYFVTYGTSMAFYAYFVLTRQVVNVFTYKVIVILQLKALPECKPLTGTNTVIIPIRSNPNMSHSLPQPPTIALKHFQIATIREFFNLQYRAITQRIALYTPPPPHKKPP